MTKRISTLLYAFIAFLTMAEAQENMIDGHEYVDLGLPSGTLWATCNVGASKPEEYGDYFAWGETQPKKDYSLATYKWYSENEYTKYGNDGKTELDLEDDAANANWGGDWRMPSKEQLLELVRYCSWEKITFNGVNGWKGVGQNGNSIFLPSAGYYSETYLRFEGSRTHYYSRMLSQDYEGYIYNISDISGNLWLMSGAGRVNGHCVRPVVVNNQSSELLLNAENFPDANFRAALASILGISEGDEITEAKIAATTTLNVGSRSIADLTGIEHFTALTQLRCGNNQLTSLDVSKNTALTALFCYNNQLTSLDVSKNTALTWLECYFNQLTSLDVSECTALIGLYCYENQLTSLDVSKNTALTVLPCFSNQIKGEAMDALVASLPTVKNGAFYVIDTKDENEGNVCTKAQVAIAKGKGWTVYDYDNNGGSAQEYEGSDPVAEGHNDGDILQGTVDGIIWTYKIISEADKTCQIGDGNASAIATSTTGALNIPSYIDGYTVIAVGSWSLFYCDRLTSINIPATVINVYRYATPKSLASLTVSANNPVLTDLDANIIVDRNTMTILAGCNVSQIPDGIVAIGDGAFRNCVFETTPTFPTSLKTIGEDGFYRCEGLKNLVLPEGIESIEDYGFYRSDIQMLYIPSTLKSLGYYVFNENRDLSEIKVSEDNLVFDSRNNCNAIIRTSSNRLVQGSNTTIIPDGIRTLGWGAFNGLESLKKMIIPEGVYDLGNYTFYGCTALEELSIPSTVSSDGFNETTFYDCLSLKTIYCYIDNPATLPSKYSGPFGSNYNPKERTYEQATLYVPYGTKSKYENTDGWNKFKNIVEMEYVPVAFGDRILIQERQVGDRKYNLYKSMASSNKRINGDGTPFYLTQITLDITDETGTESFVINEGTLYTNEWTDDLSWNWMSPCMMIDLDRKKMYVFSSSKATDAYYGMEGYVYSSPLNEPAFTNELVFEQANWGWYSFFGGVTNGGQPILKHFSYAGYLTSPRHAAMMVLGRTFGARA